MADLRMPFEIFQLDADALVLPLGTQRFFAVAADIAFALEPVENTDAQRRSRRQDAVLLRRLAVADAGEHITQRIDTCNHVCSLPARTHLPGSKGLLAPIDTTNVDAQELEIIQTKPHGTPAKR